MALANTYNRCLSSRSCGCSFFITLKHRTMKTTTQSGKVKVVNALAALHKILNQIAPEGTIHCQMTTTVKGASFTFNNNGIEATFQIKKGGIK